MESDPHWINKREMKMSRLSYDDCYQSIARYAPDMLSHFNDRWERFPQGGNAAMIVNFLNDKAQEYYKFGCDEVGKELANVAGEIIFREK